MNLVTGMFLCISKISIPSDRERNDVNSLIEERNVLWRNYLKHWWNKPTAVLIRSSFGYVTDEELRAADTSLRVYWMCSSWNIAFDELGRICGVYIRIASVHRCSPLAMEKWRTLTDIHIPCSHMRLMYALRLGLSEPVWAKPSIPHLRIQRGRDEPMDAVAVAQIAHAQIYTTHIPLSSVSRIVH